MPLLFPSLFFFSLEFTSHCVAFTLFLSLCFVFSVQMTMHRRCITNGDKRASVERRSISPLTVGIVLYFPLWFHRALFLTTRTTKSQCWDVLCLVLMFGMALLCMFLLHFNDEHHHTVTMTIASLTPMLSWLKGAPPGTYPSSHQQKKSLLALSNYFLHFEHIDATSWE